MIESSVALGFVLAAIAGLCYDSGYALQALEARRAPAKHSLKPTLLLHLLRRPLWVGATLLSLVGWPLQILALSMAPLTLVQPTLALGLLVLLVLGSRILKEKVGPREISAVLLIIAAVTVIALAAPADSESVDRGAPLWIALGFLALVTVMPFILGRKRVRGAVLLVLAAGAADGMAAFIAKIISEDLGEGALLAAAAWAAMIGGAVLLGLISETTALQRAPATRVAPSVLVMQIAVPVILAPLIGGEGWDNTPGGGAVLVGGLIVLVAGVAILGSSPAVAGVIAESREDE